LAVLDRVSGDGFVATMNDFDELVSYARPGASAPECDYTYDGCGNRRTWSAAATRGTAPLVVCTARRHNDSATTGTGRPSVGPVGSSIVRESQACADRVVLGPARRELDRRIGHPDALRARISGERRIEHAIRSHPRKALGRSHGVVARMIRR
jgi:hypothetical protein